MNNKLNHNKECFHCGLVVPKGTHYGIKFDDQWRDMCCPGCEAVAQAIIDNGLSDFYRKRTAYSPQADTVPDELKNYEVYSQQQDGLIEEGTVEHSLILEGISCSACIWLLEKHLRDLKGVVSFNINYATRRAQVISRPKDVQLNRILASIQEIGYKAFPYDPSKQFLQLQKERKDYISRMGLAVFCGMQVMMITVGIYIAGSDEMDPHMLTFFKWISALLTTPVVIYSAKPFFSAAWRDIKNKMPGMDVPVALGVGLAFVASIFNTYQQTGETYYESVCMFVLFLLLARFVEFLTRWYVMSSSERISQAEPTVAKRVKPDGELETLSADLLVVGDQVQINPGVTIPSDCRVIDGQSSVDESILTGENEPIMKTKGDLLLGGSHNLDDTLMAEVTCVGEKSTLSTITRLIERARIEKPGWVKLADRSASKFVFGIIILTVLTGVYGYWQNNEDWFSIALSVLVVTCPCALSLATPAAYTAAMSALFDLGIIITNGQALEKLSGVKYVVFDKTGTLTKGAMKVSGCRLEGHVERQFAFDIAISLESYSDHPIAKAFCRQPVLKKYNFNKVEQFKGLGLSGVAEGKKYFLGSKSFINQSHTLIREDENKKETQVFLASENEIIAIFDISDEIRQGVKPMMGWLKSQAKSISLLSGDQQAPVAWLAKKVGIQDYISDVSPADKLKTIEELQHNGERVAMVGDGINDAPVLAKADVSISVSGASQLARASSDVILLGDDMSSLKEVFVLSKKTNAIIRENMMWALVYNVGALPLAMNGYVEPWQAALGMSISSLVVVLNSFRLRGLSAHRSKKHVSS